MNENSDFLELLSQRIREQIMEDLLLDLSFVKNPCYEIELGAHDARMPPKHAVDVF